MLRRVWTQFSCFFVLFASVDNSRINGDEIAKAINFSMRNAHAIQAYEFVVQEETTTKIGGPVKTERHHFRQSGGQTRVDLFLKNLDKPGMILAYDGERFQNFDEKRSVLSFSQKNRFPSQYGAMNPMLAPYFWVVEFPGGVWSDIKQIDIWTEVANRAILIGQQSLNGLDCIEIEIDPKASTSITYRVVLAKQKGYLPVKLVAKQPAHTYTMVVDEIKKFDSDGGKYFVPVSMSINDEGVLRRYSIDLKSLRVNHRIDEAVFTLSPSMAKTFDDYDRNVARNEKFMQTPIKPETIRRPIGVGVVIVLSSVVLVFVFLYRRFRV